MKYLLFLLAIPFLVACEVKGGDAADDPEIGDSGAAGVVAQLPSNSTTCGDFSAEINDGETEEEVVEELEEDVDELGLDIMSVERRGKTIVIVGCGGTIVTDNDSTTVTNEVAPSEEEE